MSNDPDLVRVDLLKFRRKAYLSYPKGSAERKAFLKVLLQNELRLTQEDIPHNLIDFIVEGDSAMFKNAVKQFLLWAFPSLMCAITFVLLLPIIHTFAYFFAGISTACLWIGINYLYEYFLYRKSVKSVKAYSEDMRKYITKISNDIKRLDGPK